MSGQATVVLGWSLVRVALAAPAAAVVIALGSGGSGVAFAAVVAAGTAVLVRPWANLHRAYTGRVLARPVPRPYPWSPDRRWRTRLALAARDPATGRDLAWLVANGTAGFALVAASAALLVAGLGGVALSAVWPWLPATAHLWVGPVRLADQLGAQTGVPPAAVGLLAGLPLLLAWWLVTPALTRADAGLSRSLLAPTERALLAARVRELAASRSETVDAAAAELRRIERDLHDGLQARLVALGLNLGLVERAMDTDPAAARELLAEARTASGQALVELRDVVRGIHPPVLADRGLAGAAQAVALAQPLPVHVVVDLPGRLPAPVESAAYFALAEALANVARHSGARTARLVLRHTDERLVVVVSDDGTGGADPDAGTGLHGIRRRLTAFDGTLTVSSPAGGPTTVTMEIPCASSSPRTTLSCAAGSSGC